MDACPSRAPWRQRKPAANSGRCQYCEIQFRNISDLAAWIVIMQEGSPGNSGGQRRRVVSISKAFALASASDEARNIRDEVGFFQMVRAALVKSADGAGMSSADREFAIRQILDRAVVSTEIVDILAAAGITTPDISILSDDFLAEIRQLEKKTWRLRRFASC